MQNTTYFSTSAVAKLAVELGKSPSEVKNLVPFSNEVDDTLLDILYELESGETVTYPFFGSDSSAFPAPEGPRVLVQAGTLNAGATVAALAALDKEIIVVTHPDFRTYYERMALYLFAPITVLVDEDAVEIIEVSTF